MLSSSQVTELKTAIQNLVPRIRDIRHALHRQPEIHFNEFQTRNRVRQELKGSSIQWHPNRLETDVVGDLIADTAFETILLRADMDALPISETTNLPYQSEIPGMMHACGHDGHTSMMIGTALILEQFRDLLPVNVRFVFQPGEEMVAGGKKLVQAGVCDNIFSAYALHGGPGRPVNTVSSLPGTMLAAAEFFEVTFDRFL